LGILMPLNAELFWKLFDNPYGISGDPPLHLYLHLKQLVDPEHLPGEAHFDEYVHQLRQKIVDDWLAYKCYDYDTFMSLVPIAVYFPVFPPFDIFC